MFPSCTGASRSAPNRLANSWSRRRVRARFSGVSWTMSVLYPRARCGNALAWKFERAGFTELFRLFLGQRVVNESAGPGLDAGQVLQLVRRAERRQELDAEVVGLRPTAVHRALLQDHHVRHGEAPERIVLTHDALQYAGQVAHL